MADEADFAQIRIDAEREIGIAKVRNELRNAPVNTTGICVDCDNPIGAARLASVPNAQRCIYCQREYERS